jgi:hypothetical protein
MLHLLRSDDAGRLLRLDVVPNLPFTIESTPSLTPPVTWTPLLTTNVPESHFEYVDASAGAKGGGYYRAR